MMEAQAQQQRHDIGWAREQLLAGKRVRRPGWSGSAMYIYLDGGGVAGDGTKRKPFVVLHRGMGPEHYDQPGWVCSQPDLLEDDWELAP